MADGTAQATPGAPCPPNRLETPLILHILPSFAVGGVQIRTTKIINHLGKAFRHSIVALDGNYACKSRLANKAPVDFPSVPTERKHPVRATMTARATLRRLRPDLLFTYNWGSIDWALANAIAPISRHVHFEDGFGPEEANKQLSRRVYFRRIALARTAHIVVPSETLVQLATHRWKLPQDKIVLIPNGVDCSRFDALLEPSDGRGVETSAKQLIVGTVAPLRPEKNLEFLLQVFAAITERFDVKLVIIGDGPERPKLTQLTQSLEISDKVEFTGHIEAVETVLAGFDVFALTSRTEQMPISLLEAMAAGKPVVALDVGDVKEMLAPENRVFVVPKDDESAIRGALEDLLSIESTRRSLGHYNALRVRANYTQERMLKSYEHLLDRHLGNLNVSN